ncbi:MULTISPECIES: hypothetical protein [unclassified Ensifer]|uniref:hypothetical protein n=1 Tax=unclassified Ensifer TaxID=2633371 RepID=UPI000812F607|nr:MULTISPECIES: hypothetical protein [unclassified Ensifer]OCP07991.1 hypothetical protein BC362_10295 [Ensifer sp. LC14]OCP10899.1 hypothetical protein BC374_17670 [Ensifer sp. LC13]OCP11555.1 hypothetical protein BBX50_18185 [Ensifer sp. LC11]OCP33374.1 hypothetical protein BC364_17075 [Ensifer sp. LC499]
MAYGDPYFAWIDETEGFDQVLHRRFDEEIEEWVLDAEEDGFAVGTLKVRPPEGGMLKTTRKLWGLLSVELSDGSLDLIWKGKVDSFPLGGNPEEATLKFKCAPGDWQDRQLTLLQATKSQPHWDDVLVAKESRNDPTEILDGQSRVICFHPATHVCELHDIFGVGLDEWDIGLEWFEDSLSAEITEPPISYVDVTVTAKWKQQLSGSFSATAAVRSAFGGTDPATLTGEDFENRWPGQGDGISNNNGYTVQTSSLKLITPNDGRPTEHTFRAAAKWFPYLTDANLTSPGTRNPPLPITYYNADIDLSWTAEQSRSEVIKMRLKSGVQDTSLGNGGGRTLDITLQDITVDDVSEAWRPGVFYAVGQQVRAGSKTYERLRAGVSEATWGEDFTYMDLSTFPPTLRQNWEAVQDQSPLGGIGSDKYFPTVRGHTTLLAVLMKARAILAEAMRCIEIEFEVPLMDALEAGLYLGKRIRVEVPPGRLAIEGEIIVGKVSAYTMTSNASDDTCRITIKAACGSGKSTTGTGAQSASQTGETWDQVVLPSIAGLTPTPMATGGIVRARVENALQEQIDYISARDYDPAAGRTNEDATNPEKLIRDVPTRLTFDLVPIAAADDLVLEHSMTIPVPFEGPRQIDFGGA